ncbi:MAG: hypothetical protein ACRDQ4_03375 [Pseudonocardiaceae bacterium]
MGDGRRPSAAYSGRDYLGYRVTEPTHVERITVLAAQQTGVLERWSIMPGAGPHRRRVLAAGATLLLAGPAALAGCTLPTRAPKGPDPLESPARRAEADAALATAVAQLATQPAGHADPVLAAAATALATDRMTHAATLRAELGRARPRPASRSGSAPVAPLPAIPDLAGARGTLAQAVRAAQDEAAELAMTLPGYRAALLASVAACCASHAALLS